MGLRLERTGAPALLDCSACSMDRRQSLDTLPEVAAIPIELWYLLAVSSGPLYYSIVALAVRERREVALKAIGCLLMLLLSSIFHTSIVPPRFESGDLVVLGASLVGAVWAGRRMPDLMCCAVFGLFQAFMLLQIFSNFYVRDMRLGWRYRSQSILGEWAVLVGLYTLGVVLLCWLVRLKSRPAFADGHPHCTTCGYDLYGLPQPRCPECGDGVADNKGKSVREA